MAASTRAKVLFFGDLCVGKTCLVHRLRFGKFDAMSVATGGFTFQEVARTISGDTVTLELWDGPAKAMREGPRTLYTHGVHVIVLVYSISNESTLKSALEAGSVIKREVDRNVVFFLVGNKTDSECEREVTREEGLMACGAIGAYFHEVSAKTGDGIQDFIENIIRRIGIIPEQDRVQVRRHESLLGKGCKT